VATLTPILAIYAVISIEEPPFGQLAASPVNCPESGARIVSPAHDKAWIHPVKICYTGKKTVNPVSVIVTPVSDIPSQRLVIDCDKLFSCLSIENSQIFRAA
jgi:hypothetical protein